MIITFRFDSAALDGKLARLQAAVPMAIARGLNQGGDRVRTAVQRGLKAQTGVKAYSSITSRIRTQRAFAGGLAYAIVATGKGLPIKEFPLHVTSSGVDAMPWGKEHLFKRSFRQLVKGGLRARIGAARLPVRALYGPSLPKELGHGEVPDIFYSACEKFVPASILAALNGVMRSI